MFDWSHSEQDVLKVLPEDLDEIDEVWMLEVLEHPDLPEGDLLDERIVFALHEFLRSEKRSGKCYK